jgi:urease beta subunit
MRHFMRRNRRLLHDRFGDAPERPGVAGGTAARREPF